MITIHSNEEAKKYIKDGVLDIDDDLEIAFDGFEIKANIDCMNIYSKDYSRNINAGDIDASDINAENINAGNIDASDINAKNINAGDINAWDINAKNINAGDINAWNINAGNISYHAVCFAYMTFTCKSIEGRRENSKHFCLDGEIFFKDDINETIEIGGNKYSKKEVEEALKDLKPIS